LDLTFDHKVLEGARATRRYFAKFERIMGHLKEVSQLSKKNRVISEAEADVLAEYLESLTHTFTALSYKYLMANRAGGTASRLLSIDKTDSGFPIYQEIMQLAADAVQAKEQLKSLPSAERLKKDMITHILTDRSSPIQLQYALSQRLYYEHINDSSIFLSQNHPKGMWIKGGAGRDRREYLIHWASYDSQTNLPAIYLMLIEDTGSRPLPRDERRWPRVKSHLMAQAVSSLKLLTIAKGFDTDFHDLHPKTLRRFHIGPMYSHNFTEQRGPLRDILADASGPPGLDWTLAWTVESLISTKTTEEKSGIFRTSQREVYAIDTMDPKAIESGASDVRRSLILPHRAFQVLEEKDDPTLRGATKYVVGKNSKILSYN